MTVPPPDDTDACQSEPPACPPCPITILDRSLLARPVLGPDVATIDRKASISIQRDEDARARDLGGIEDQRPLFERFHRHLELTEPGIDLLGVFVLTGVLLLQRAVLGEERNVGGAFLVGQRRRIASQTPQTVAIAIGQVGRHLDPLPAFGRECLGLSLKLLGNQPVEEGRVLEPAAVIALKEIAQDDTARRLIGIDTHEDRATIRGRERGLRQHATEGVGLLVSGVLHRVTDLHLMPVVGVHRERHQLLERHAILGIDIEQGRGHGRELQALLDDLRRDEEGSRNLFLALTLFTQGLESAELVERMQGGALHVLRQRVVLGEDLRCSFP